MILNNANHKWLDKISEEVTLYIILRLLTILLIFNFLVTLTMELISSCLNRSGPIDLDIV
mgnify:CR=1 FL=1